MDLKACVGPVPVRVDPHAEWLVTGSGYENVEVPVATARLCLVTTPGVLVAVDPCYRGHGDSYCIVVGGE